jgi:hypothetical protein
MDYYIYYKSKVEDADNIMASFDRLKNLVLQKIQIDMHLQRRPLEDQGLFTWMEIYRDIPEQFDVLLKSAVDESDITRFIAGNRHVELFITPCRAPAV